MRLEYLCQTFLCKSRSLAEDETSLYSLNGETACHHPPCRLLYLTSLPLPDLPDKSWFRLRESIKKFRLGIWNTMHILPVSPTSPPPDRRTTLPTFFDRRHQTRGSTALLDDILVERDLVSTTFHRLFKVLLFL